MVCLITVFLVQGAMLARRWLSGFPMSKGVARWCRCACLDRVTAVVLLCLAILPVAGYAAVVDYELVAMRRDGGAPHHLAINDQVPAPTLTAQVGDQLRIRVVNRLDEPVLLHWHGLLLPYDQDGVPGISSPPIAPGASREFHFAVRQSGTYWYHSHVLFQEQDGLYGAIVLRGAEQDFPELNSCAEDRAVVLSDWDRTAGFSIMRRLKQDGDWFARKKGTTQHWLGALVRGSAAIENRLQMSLMRMGSMDVSDVGYDRFWANGEPRHALGDLGSGCVRLRLVNAAASTIFDIDYAAGSLQIVAADGLPVEPLTRQRLRIGMGETYDLLLPTVAGEARELRATANDGSGWSSVLLGAGQLRSVLARPPPDPYTAHAAHRAGTHAAHGGVDTGTAGELLPYRQLRARTARTAAERRPPDRSIDIHLSGSMDGYNWSFDGVPFRESEPLEFVPGELLRITLINQTMMEHPIHLHGHFFRVLHGGQGEYDPLKHTLVVAPLQRQTIEVLAVEPGRWIMHCHNLYHMMAGMGRAVGYRPPPLGTAQQRVAALPPTPGGVDQLPAVRRARAALGDNLERRTIALEQADQPLASAVKHHHRRHFWWRSEGTLLSNVVAVEGQLRDDRNQWQLSVEHGLTEREGRRHRELELAYQRRLGRYAAAHVGYQVEGAQSGQHSEAAHSVLIGGTYTLPLLAELELEWNSSEGVIARLSNSHQLSDQLSFQWQLAVGDDDDAAELHYHFSQRFSAVLHYSRRYGVGAGIALLL